MARRTLQSFGLLLLLTILEIIIMTRQYFLVWWLGADGGDGLQYGG